MYRLQPYTTNQVRLNALLQKKLRIPMNQREYSWEDNEIEVFLNDLFNTYEEGKYVEKMGSIINLNYNNDNDIYDGQQRILTLIIILINISCLSPKLENKIKQLLSVDAEIDNLTEEQEKIKNDHNCEIIPKIYCVNPCDMLGLINIFNNKIHSPQKYIKNIDEMNSNANQGNNKIPHICDLCNTSIVRHKDFIRHMIDKHDYKIPDKTTKLHSAFIYIYNCFIKKKYNEEKLIDLYKFILNDIDIQFFECNDPDYVSRIFDWENNRGKKVQSLDIIKNQILVKIPNDKKLEIYDKWDELKHKENMICNDFGQKMIDIGIQLYNEKFDKKKKIDKQKLFNPIIQSDNVYIEINKFFKIVDQLHKIIEKINDDRYGRLIIKRSKIAWEGFECLLLPLFYTKNTIDTSLIKLIAKWRFRNLPFETLTFNSVCYAGEFIRITNDVLKNNQYDYFKEIEHCLKKNKSSQINEEEYIRRLTNMTFKLKEASSILMFLESCLNTDAHIVPLDYTLEHIIPQNEKKNGNLTETSLINNIGNLTLLEGRNSANGAKGNSSLGSKPYDKKKEQYKKSNSMITRMIPDDFQNFSEKDIRQRNKKIVELLNTHTNY
jgi:hypothetical protein